MTKRRKIVIALGLLLVGVFIGVLVIGAVGYRLYSKEGWRRANFSLRKYHESAFSIGRVNFLSPKLRHPASE